MKRLSLVLPLLVVALAAPAAAETVTLPDPPGDATAYTFNAPTVEKPRPGAPAVRMLRDEECPDGPAEEPTTVNDIQRLVVRHTATRVVLAMRVTDLTRPRDTSVDFWVATPRQTWSVNLSWFRGRYEVYMGEPLEMPELEPGQCEFVVGQDLWNCPGSVGSIDRAGDRVRVSLRRACFRTPRWVRAGAEVYGWTDSTSYSDSWARPGHPEGDAFDPVLGRRVYADAPAR